MLSTVIFVCVFSSLFTKTLCFSVSPWSTLESHSFSVLRAAKADPASTNPDDAAWEALTAELVAEDDDDDEDDDWTPDREKARQERRNARIYAERVTQEQKAPTTTATTSPESHETNTPKASPYTEEEETVIAAMGGKTRSSRRRREDGYLGDSTLQDICTDYSVPLCWLADVLCTWGVPIPIHTHDRLGDLVTGEQAFAILEAVNSLDIAELHDRYSDCSLERLCNEWNIPLADAFQMAMKEGWGLPMGVQTCLRVDQERELLRVLGDHENMRMLDEDEYDE